MKALRIFSLAAFFMAVCNFSFAQTKTETFKVSGNCGMCKSNIEKAAKAAGAKEAKWDMETKILTVTYKSSTTNTAKIQEKIAAVGYDNAGATAPEQSYNSLHACCKYDRATGVAKESCCSGDAKCADHKEAMPDCCKDGKCSKPGHDGKDCCKKS